jgi:hypothetical protein
MLGQAGIAVIVPVAIIPSPHGACNTNCASVPTRVDLPEKLSQVYRIASYPKFGIDLGYGCVIYFRVIPNLGLIYVAKLSQIYPRSIPNLSHFFLGYRLFYFPNLG